MSHAQEQAFVDTQKLVPRGITLHTSCIAPHRLSVVTYNRQSVQSEDTRITFDVL